MENGTRKINILLVDDNPANLLSLETILAAPDRHLASASSGEEALRYLLDQDAAVILLDVHMPNIDGIETAALIRGRERTRNIPIIFLTAHDSAGASHISRGYSLGAVDYIVKPVDPEALKSKVAVFVELYRKTEQVKEQASLLQEKNVELENANLQQLSRLIELGQRLASERDPEQLLETFCHEARDIVCAQFGATIVLDENKQNHFCASGFDREKAIGLNAPETCLHFLNDRFKKNKSLRLSWPEKDLKKMDILPKDVQITSFLAAPLLRQGEVQGWLYLANKLNAKEFSEADERLAVTLTSQAAVAWENARLYAESQRHGAELELEIAERKRVEKERALLLMRERAARAEAEEANRLKDEFLATVSHELRAPLNAMLGWVTLARKAQLDEENRVRALETIERNVRIQKKLIDDLLDVSRIITGKLTLDIKPANLIPIIEAAIESARPAADRKGVDLQVKLDPSPGPFPVDAIRLQQVIWNLVYNAVKFTPTGGSAEVRLRFLDDQAEIVVSDTGIGIAPQFLPYVFDRFRQADGSITKKHGGLGLGLAIVRHLVEMHGGAVTADSAGEGKGATFKIRLPLLPPVWMPDRNSTLTLRHQERILPEWEISLAGLRALVVDDQDDARELLATLLRLQSVEVLSAGGKTEALQILSIYQPDIVISDIAMPNGDGYELIKQIRSRGYTIPAISLTAHASVEDRIHALTAGFQMHLPKPVEPYELVVSIANLTGRLPNSPGAERSPSETAFANSEPGGGAYANT